MSWHASLALHNAQRHLLELDLSDQAYTNAQLIAPHVPEWILRILQKLVQDIASVQLVGVNKTREPNIGLNTKMASKDGSLFEQEYRALSVPKDLRGMLGRLVRFTSD